MKSSIALLAAVALATACGGNKTADCSTDPKLCPANWTILVYVVADNNLEPDALVNLGQMAQVGSTTGLNIVVQVDRSLKYDTGPIGNIAASATTKRLFVQNGSFQQLADLGDLDAASPAVLADFIQWGLHSYPATNTALVLWDHGGGWGGFGEDESQQDFMALASIKTALATGLQQAGRSGFTVLGFDACLMSSYEVMEAVKPYARYFLASEETEPGLGWDYRKLQIVHDAPTTDALTLSKAIVDGFTVQNANEKNTTLALTDLTLLTPLETAVGAISTQVSGKLATVANSIAQQRSVALEFGRNPDPSASQNMVDLGQLFASLGASDAANFGALRDQVASALATAVLYKSDGPAAASATGVSIFFPPTTAAYADSRATYETLTGIDSWRAFLEAYLAQGATVAAPAFTSHAATVTANTSGLTIAGSIDPATASSIGSAMLRYGYSFPASGTSPDEIDFYGDRAAQVSGSSVSASWSKTLLQLTQGTVNAYAYLSLSSRGTGYLVADVPLAYLPSGGSDCSATNVSIAARELVVDNSTGSVVQDIYYDNSHGAVSQLTPVSGSAFRSVVYFLSGSANFTQAASQQGWGCVGPALRADEAIAIGFVTPGLGSGVQEAFLLSIQNAGGKGDDAAAVGIY